LTGLGELMQQPIHYQERKWLSLPILYTCQYLRRVTPPEQYKIKKIVLIFPDNSFLKNEKKLRQWKAIS